MNRGFDECRGMKVGECVDESCMKLPGQTANPLSRICSVREGVSILCSGLLRRCCTTYKLQNLVLNLRWEPLRKSELGKTCSFWINIALCSNLKPALFFPIIMLLTIIQLGLRHKKPPISFAFLWKAGNGGKSTLSFRVCWSNTYCSHLDSSWEVLEVQTTRFAFKTTHQVKNQYHIVALKSINKHFPSENTCTNCHICHATLIEEKYTLPSQIGVLFSPKLSRNSCLIKNDIGKPM